MGVYNQTCIYLGRLLTRESFYKIASLPASWFTDTHDPASPPRRYAPDPIIEEHEVQREAVEWAEVVRVIGQERLQPLLDVSAKDLATLRTYLESAGDPMYRIYMIETECCISDITPSPPRVKKNIRVMRCNS